MSLPDAFTLLRKAAKRQAGGSQPDTNNISRISKRPGGIDKTDPTVRIIKGVASGK
jgi:hypothetical protein